MLAGITLMAAAFALRAAQFGNPINGLDEQYYLLVGDRMWQGLLPYVDLWDRKPFGLFLIFAGIRLLPGDGVIAAQVVATMFAAATALVATLIARRRTGWAPATMAGILYLGAINELWGETSQTPVFYNLFVALAALLVLRATDAPLSPRGRRLGIAAMLLAGLALQVKTIALFEGAFLGCWLLAAAWRTGARPPALLAFTLRLALAGAAPTLAVMALYLALGHFDGWWQANILSVIAKGAPVDPGAHRRLIESLVLAAPLLALALLGLWAGTQRFARWSGEILFLIGWGWVTAIQFFVIGGFWPHYALPLALSCAVLAASGFALPRLGPALFAGALAWPLWHAVMINPAIARSDRAAAARVVAAIPPQVRDQCMFVYEGPVAYYLLAGGCTVTPWSFSAHLRSAVEAPTLGVDPVGALRAALDSRPAAILTIANSQWNDRFAANDRLIAQVLARDYVRAAALPNRDYGPAETILVWRRRDLPATPVEPGPAPRG
ncbi:hypothetical protein TPR58_13725 [Sphingomonas sp. HF-S3]|uniref:Glycosyltransferase RgtA/B/C/D-like domain-containing protein n=1 Tax=Sphingomonas rustica TaxID=3103142 RepID=A0ABV0BAN5_9SPHN